MVGMRHAGLVLAFCGLLWEALSSEIPGQVTILSPRQGEHHSYYVLKWQPPKFKRHDMPILRYKFQLATVEVDPDTWAVRKRTGGWREKEVRDVGGELPMNSYNFTHLLAGQHYQVNVQAGNPADYGTKVSFVFLTDSLHCYKCGHLDLENVSYPGDKTKENEMHEGLMQQILSRNQKSSSSMCGSHTQAANLSIFCPPARFCSALDVRERIHAQHAEDGASFTFTVRSRTRGCFPDTRHIYQPGCMTSPGVAELVEQRKEELQELIPEAEVTDYEVTGDVCLTDDDNSNTDLPSREPRPIGGATSINVMTSVHVITAICVLFFTQK